MPSLGGRKEAQGHRTGAKANETLFLTYSVGATAVSWWRSGQRVWGGEQAATERGGSRGAVLALVAGPEADTLRAYQQGRLLTWGIWVCQIQTHPNQSFWA